MTLSRLYGVSTDYLLFGEEFKEQKNLTDKDYVCMLVTAADKLNLPILAVYPDDGYSTSTVYRLDLNDILTIDNASYVSFLDKWKKLRNARDGDAIDYSDYHALISKKLAELPNYFAFEPLD